MYVKSDDGPYPRKDRWAKQRWRAAPANELVQMEEIAAMRGWSGRDDGRDRIKGKRGNEKN